jgi:Domain of unknown function (DUF4365)
MRKLRTRQHIIEDLGFNHIEKQILLAGFTMYRYPMNDYGIDGIIQTFRETGEIDQKIVNFQLKSTDHIQYSSLKQVIKFDLNMRDLEFWLSTDRPTLLILFDAQKETAYFIDLEIYFQKNRESLSKVHKFVRVYFPIHQVFNTQAVLALR